MAKPRIPAEPELKPRLVFRVGVTGHRPKPDRPLPVALMREQACTALKAVKEELAHLAEDAATQRSYSSPPQLVLVSPLAEGADQIVADVARDLGYALRVIMPFPRAEYLNDFKTPDAKQGFQTLLDAAAGRVLELDGGRDSAGRKGLEAESYEVVGRMVVRNCDLLLALWDGEAAEGRGGTADIVTYAARFRTAVWWITPNGSRPAQLIRHPHDLRHVRKISGSDEAAVGTAALRQLVAAQIAPPGAPPRHRSEAPGRAEDGHADGGPLHRFRTWLEHRAIRKQTPYDRFLAEPKAMTATGITAFLASRFGRRFGRFRDRAARPVPPGAPAPEFTGYYGDLYRVPDERGVALSNLDRSAYLSIFRLAALALTAAACGVAWGGDMTLKAAVLIVEFVAIAGIFALFFLDKMRRWHARWIDYRFLAELFRKQHFLAMLGWSLPPTSVREAARYTGGAREWVGWYFHACLRAAPFQSAVIDGDRKQKIRDAVLRDLIADQIAYHDRNAVINGRINSRLAAAAERLFLLSVVLIAVKAIDGFIIGFDALLQSGLSAAGFANPLGPHLVSQTIAVLLVVLPSLSAMYFAIRAQGEFEILHQRSNEMTQRLDEAKARICTLHTAAPRASEAIGAELFAVATEMLAEVKGWGAIFQVKAIEAA